MIPYDMINERDMRSTVQTFTVETFKMNTKYYAKLQCTHHPILSVIYVWQTLGLFFISILPSTFTSLFHKKPRHKSIHPLKNFNIVQNISPLKKIQYLLNYHALKS